MTSSVLCVVFFLFLINTDVTVKGKYAATPGRSASIFPRQHCVDNLYRAPIKSVRRSPIWVISNAGNPRRFASDPNKRPISHFRSIILGCLVALRQFTRYTHPSPCNPHALGISYRCAIGVRTLRFALNRQQCVIVVCDRLVWLWR